MTDTTQSRVAEIVTFKLNDGVSDAEYLKLNQPSHAFSSAAKGYVSRQLSKGEDGTWTDYVLWETLEDAKAVQSQFMAQDFAPAMVGAINGETLKMEHQHIMWQPS